MDNKFKLRFSRIFLNSCKSRRDVAQSHHDLLDDSPFLSHSPPPPRPLPLPRPSICNPRTPPSLHVNTSCIISSKEARRKTRQPFAYNPFYDRKDGRRKKKKNKGGAKAMLISHDRDFYSSDDEREEDDEDDDERTVETLFSSRSLSSSESSENRRRMRRRRRREVGLGGVKGSMAVVKKSRDPKGDFRRSMVEMIIERQIFGERELHQLLLCFLSLNSVHHHSIIIHVYKEIWEALFCT